MDNNIFTRDRNEEKLLENTELFTTEELRNILITRKTFDSKILRKDKAAFFSYIEHEKSLWNKLNVFTNKRDNNLQTCIARRIIKLHTLGLSYFKDDRKLWLSYIKFCIQAKYYMLLADAFSQALLSHTDEDMFLLAAKWEWGKNNNPDKALHYLNKGIYYNPYATALYLELFKLELEVAKKVYKNTTILSEEDNKPLKIFELFKQKISNVHFYISLLKTASEYTFTATLQGAISAYLITVYQKEEIVWHSLAQRELEGHHLTLDNRYEYVEASRVRERFQYCFEKYRYAVNILPTHEMWDKYLTTLVNLYEDNNVSSPYIKDAFLLACKEAHKANVMSEEHYAIWLNCIQDCPDLLQILDAATSSKPQYLQLWMYKLLYHMTRKHTDKVESVFNEAIQSLGDNSAPIWRLKLQYYQLDRNDKIEDTYREALHYSAVISKILTPQFLEWLMLFKSIEVARKEYEDLASRKPYSIEIHKKMVELESTCAVPNTEQLKMINALAMAQFGNLWIDYVKEKINCGKGADNFDISKKTWNYVCRFPLPKRNF